MSRGISGARGERGRETDHGSGRIHVVADGYDDQASAAGTLDYIEERPAGSTSGASQTAGDATC